METHHWIEYRTDDGNIPYYYNKETKMTQWEKPEEMEYFFYGRQEQKEVIEQVRYPDANTSIWKWFQDIGVDSISSLRYNSIRTLHSYHMNSVDELQWNDIVCEQNGLLLFVICSQFYNCHTCYEELLACMEELLLFLPCVKETLPILLDSHFGGGEKCISCLSYFLHSCNAEENTKVEIACELYQAIWPYVPHSWLFVYECQQILYLKQSITVMKCLIYQCQHHVKTFVECIKAGDAVSSLVVQLANETGMDDAFFPILWKFIGNVLRERGDILYVSDEMVLLDIALRNKQNYGVYGDVMNVFKEIRDSSRWEKEMNCYRKEEMDSL